jgi:hypothetical protein
MLLGACRPVNMASTVSARPASFESCTLFSPGLTAKLIVAAVPKKAVKPRVCGASVCNATSTDASMAGGFTSRWPPGRRPDLP